MANNKPTPGEQVMFDQVRELCQLTSKACHKISVDSGIPMRMVVKFFVAMMDHLIEETDKEVGSV